MKPILFNTPMTRAILDGRKTETRRLVKTGGHEVLRGGTFPGSADGPKYGAELDDHSVVVAPYQKGDILYVRETFTKFYYSDEYGYTHFDQPMYYYAADGEPDIRLVDGDGFEEEDQRIRWTPSIHMPKEAARLFLRVTDVRAERLQESFNAPTTPILAVQAEGIDIGDTCRDCIFTYGNPCCVDDCDDDSTLGECGMLDENRGEFSNLWDSAIKPADRERYGWAANPWVWVICFERCGKPEEDES